MTEGTSRNSGEKTRGRGPGRPFKPGNPGKPRGATSRITREAQLILDGNADALTKKAVEMALAGDSTALRLCMERLLPPRKDRPVVLPDFPDIKTAADCLAATSSIVAAVAAGRLTPAEAEAVQRVLGAFVHSFEIVELERRLSALEGK